MNKANNQRQVVVSVEKSELKRARELLFSPAIIWASIVTDLRGSKSREKESKKSWKKKKKKKKKIETV